MLPNCMTLSHSTRCAAISPFFEQQKHIEKKALMQNQNNVYRYTQTKQNRSLRPIQMTECIEYDVRVTCPKERKS